MRAVAVLSTAFLGLLLASTVDAQCLGPGGLPFFLPAWGTDGSYQTWGQYVPSQPGLSGNRLWQANLCQPVTNAACQSDNVSNSYIYELSSNDGTAGSCDVGFYNFVDWFVSTAMDSNGATWPSLNGSFSAVTPAGTRVAEVALICGDTPLSPVAYPGTTNQWYTFYDSSLNLWTWNIVFATNQIPNICSDTPLPPNTTTSAPNTDVPVSPPSPPGPAGTCQLNGAYFKLPSFNGTVRQWVPSVPELNSARNWQVSLCAPTLPTCSPASGNAAIESFVFESAPSTGVCAMQLNVQVTNWTQAYGGINAVFANLAGDRVANVTLTCGPFAELQVVDTAPYGQGWNTHRLPNSVGQGWAWDMWFTSSLVPGC